MSLKEIFVENLSKIKGTLTYDELVKIAGGSSSMWAKYLNTKNAAYNNLMPNAESLVKLCQHFKVSLDWLLGCETPHETNNKYTMADIIRGLFWIDEYADLEIIQHEDGFYYPGFDGTPGYNYDSYELRFSELDGLLNHEINNKLNDFLKQWKEIKEFCDGKEIGASMLALWKKDVLEKAEKIPICKGLVEYPPDDDLPFN